MSRVAFLKPTFPPPSEIAEDYAAISARGVFTNGGPVEREFVRGLEAWIGSGVRVAVVSSCTTGLELAMRALLLPGRRSVPVASFTFAAGPLAIIHCGREPLFIDIDVSSWQPRIDEAEQILDRQSSDVAGILLTSTFGVADDAISRWEELARHHRVPLIIDCASGFGSTYAWGERVGARGDCEAFSFHATKTLAAGEGGAVAARDPDLVTAVNRLRNFGFDDSHQTVSAGTNAKVPELTAAIGSRQLDALPARLELRRAVLAAYVERLQPLGVSFQPGVQRSALAFVPALLPSQHQRDALLRALEEADVECRVYYNPLHQHPLFQDARTHGCLAVTENVATRIVCLPMADHLGVDAIERILAATLSALAV